MKPARKKISIQLIGPFVVTDQVGKEITPRGRKTCAMLAILAVSPNLCRSRKWLQDKLWSDRGDAQGAASLRQSLVEARRSFGELRDVIQTDYFQVSLTAEDVEVDAVSLSPEQAMRLKQNEFLEGIDIRDPQFEDWLSLQRRELAIEADLIVGTSTNNEFPPPRRSTEIGTVVLSREGQGTGDISDTILDIACQSLQELGAVQVVDTRTCHAAYSDVNEQVAPEPSVSVSISTLREAQKERHSIRLKSTSLNKTLWTTNFDNESPVSTGHQSDFVLTAANYISTISLDEAAREMETNGLETGEAFCAQAIRQLYKLGGANFQIADELFAKAYECCPKAIFLGWRAYVRTFMLAERQFQCRQTVIEEAEAYISKALELEPYNSHIASFAAQVHNIVFRSYVGAYEFAQRSVDLNCANPIGWSQLGAAKCHLGKARSGFEDTRYAVRISGSAPFKFQLAGTSCIAGTMARDIPGAIEAGEIGNALAPKFGPPLRYLPVLYFHNDQLGRARSTLSKLQQIEPDFSFEMMRDRHYPSAGLLHSGLLDDLPTTSF